MRLIHLAPAALGLLLIGCGADEPDEPQTPPAPTTEQPAPAPAPTTPPPAGGTTGETGPASGDIQIGEPVSPGNSPATEDMENSTGGATGGTTTPPASGSGGATQ
ncbi:hypothetical protein [Stutzerimonas azotifigens]|uniref:hypothetical protein n=1 Tax=Stutzerimonas azotifigens TaxID=291995 RepID=UPI00042485D4|nr:hypothetical protein [Stutzerimonas azotifigens]